MMTIAMSAAALNDTDLVAASLSGDRDAFGQIVARYQSLVCSLAYSATGSLTHSEDLAQETFVTAWKNLDALREPAKLRAWLCSIARNLTHNWLRKQGREPSHRAETLEEISESHSPTPQPHDQTISNEEQAILWRSLERIPENYREPLVLFYREHQSIEAVAEKLELSQENVRTRLARGRKLLAEEVAAFVEGALAQTNPGKAFTVGVLAALPFSVATSAKAATVAVTAAKGGATATGTTFATLLGVLAGPLLGLLGGYIGFRASLDSTRTPRERAYVIRFTKIIAAIALAFIAAMVLFSCFLSALWKTHPVLVFSAGLLLTVGYAGLIFFSAWRYNREFAKIREEERALHPAAFAKERASYMFCEPWEYRSHATLFGLPLVHVRWGKPVNQKKIEPAVGWIACGQVAYGILFATGGVAVGGISFGGAAVGIFSYGGASLGLCTFGGLAVGGLAVGGMAIGLVASGGFALAWHAAIGGLAIAHDLALGGGVLAAHANDAVAREFLANHHWLDFSQSGPSKLYGIICFGPMLLQFIFWGWMRRKMAQRKS